MQDPTHEGLFGRPAELLLPLIAGSLLSAVFIFLSIVIIGLGRTSKISKRIEVAEQDTDSNSH